MPKMVGDDDQPATKGELRSAFAKLDARIDGVETSLGARIDGLEASLRSDMRDMERRLVLDLGEVVQRALNITIEQIGSKFSVIDEKYQDLPGRVTKLERDVEDLQGRQPPSAPQRKRPARSR